eukprot:6023439-Alexandrium_andersonii.AAC.1
MSAVLTHANDTVMYVANDMQFTGVATPHLTLASPGPRGPRARKRMSAWLHSSHLTRRDRHNIG